MRMHAENFTADDTDVLAGTALDQLEGGGQLDLYFISTQADGLLTITGPDTEPIAIGITIPSQTRAPSIQDDPSYSLVTPMGGHYTVNYDEVTAATMQFLAIYRGFGEMRG